MGWKNPFREAETALNPPRKSKKDNRKVMDDLAAPARTAREAAIRAAMRERNAEKIRQNTGYRPPSSTRRGRRA